MKEPPLAATGAPAGAPPVTSAPVASESVGPEASSPSGEAESWQPQALTPPFERSRGPNDGIWEPFPDQGSGLFTTTLHPGKFSRFVEMTLVSFSLDSLSVAWVIGKNDQDAGRFESVMSIGLVPDVDQRNLVAVFNGGFQARHGRWGIFSHEIEVQPQKPEGCTIAVLGDGTLRIGAFEQLSQQLSRPGLDVRTLRQTPPCLLSAGELHPALLAGRAKPWAGENPKRKTRRRSALGVSADGRVVTYAVGIETDALDLARGMAAAGAHFAAQLDINWSWTRFAAVTQAGDRGRLEALRPEMVLGSTEYLQRPSSRDFFYVTRRPSR